MKKIYLKNIININKERFGSQKGFTLIELLVASSVFVIFMTICTSSVVSILQSQARVNTQRTTQQAIRYINETIIREIRSSNGEIDKNGVRWRPAFLYVLENTGGGADMADRTFGTVSDSDMVTATGGSSQKVLGIATFKTDLRDTKKVYRKVFYLQGGIIKVIIQDASIQPGGSKIDWTTLPLPSPSFLNDPAKDVRITAFDFSGSKLYDSLLPDSDSASGIPYLKLKIKGEAGGATARAEYRKEMTIETAAVPRGY